jgi:hypothetical protein
MAEECASLTIRYSKINDVWRVLCYIIKNYIDNEEGIVSKVEGVYFSYEEERSQIKVSKWRETIEEE